MDLRKEQEYINDFINGLSDQEFIEMLSECGNDGIMSTTKIHSHFIKEGFYDCDLKYATKSFYQSENLYSYAEYEEGGFELKRKVVA